MTTEHREGGNHISVDERARRVVDDSGYQRVSARLTGRADVATTRANERLETVRRSYELDDRALLQTQREVGRQVAEGLAPSTTEFWESVASPMAERLSDAAKAVVDEEVDELSEAAIRFRRSVRLLDMPTPATYLRADADLRLALARIEDMSFDPTPLNDIGERFQRRVRRTASLRLWPRSLLISPSETERLVDRAEIELLDHAPYAHCDKLLVAFELAHADVRTYARAHAERLCVMSSRKLRSEVPSLG